jgi:cobalt-zinc-cadmium efflux system membrane fusion protein
MRSRSAGLLLALSAVVFALSAASAAQAHEGHDHGAPPPPVSKTIAPRADASSADFELVVVARGAALVLYLDQFRTNEPVEGAEIEIDTSAGVLKPQPIAKEPGSYFVSAPFVDKPGKHDLAITVTAQGIVDILAATLTIPDGAAAAEPSTTSSWLGSPAIARDVQRRLVGTSGTTWIYLVLAFIAGAATMRFVGPRSKAKSPLVAIGILALGAFAQTPAQADVASTVRDIAQRFPDGALFVPKQTQRILGLRTVFTEERAHRRIVELPGRIVPSPNASGLVQASVGGRLFPPDGGFKPLGTHVKAGDVLAYVRPPLPLADATSQGQLARELDQQISIVTRKVERLRSIQQVIAKSQLEDAALELRGLTTRRANLERAKQEPEALMAPVDGILAAANAVAGQMAEPNAVIFHIIDPNHLWIEALSYDAQALEEVARAQLPDGRTLSVAHVGTGFADRNQAIPVHFSIADGATGLRAGQFLTVLAATADVRRGVAVPREAVLRGSNGQSLVFEHSNAERFVPREVRVEPLDGVHVLIVAGVEAGRRIVTQGAELLNQIR